MTLLGATRSSSPQWKGNDLAPARTSYGLTLARHGLTVRPVRATIPSLSQTYIAMENQSKVLVKKCCMCGEIKSSECFYMDKSKSNGLSSRCKECAKETMVQWRKQNPVKLKKGKRQYYQRNKTQLLEKSAEWRKNNQDYGKTYYQENKDVFKERRKGRETRLREMLANTRYRAKHNFLPFDLTIEYLRAIATDCCPVTGEPLDWNLEFSEKGKSNPVAPSIDKIVPTLGYTQGNVAIICNRMNRLKSDATLHELSQLVNYVRRNT